MLESVNRNIKIFLIAILAIGFAVLSFYFRDIGLLTGDIFEGFTEDPGTCINKIEFITPSGETALINNSVTKNIINYKRRQNRHNGHCSGT